MMLRANLGLAFWGLLAFSLVELAAAFLYQILLAPAQPDSSAHQLLALSHLEA